MRKLSIIFLLLIVITFIGACSSADNNMQNTSDDGLLLNQEKVLEPIYAKEIKDGTYEINVDAGSSMFRVVKCQLIVENDKMYAVMAMSGKGYGMVYMGTGEGAIADSEDAYIPFVLNDNEEKTFTVPVEALDMEIDCAAWSIKKQKWYDRTLVFESDTIPSEALDLE